MQHWRALARMRRWRTVVALGLVSSERLLGEGRVLCSRGLADISLQVKINEKSLVGMSNRSAISAIRQVVRSADGVLIHVLRAVAPERQVPSHSRPAASSTPAQLGCTTSMHQAPKPKPKPKEEVKVATSTSAVIGWV
jgi:hypothetical protein